METSLAHPIQLWICKTNVMDQPLVYTVPANPCTFIPATYGITIVLKQRQLSWTSETCNRSNSISTNVVLGPVHTIPYSFPYHIGLLFTKLN